MAGYEPKDGDISLFIEKNGGGKRPVLKGTIMIDGQRKRLALWERVSKKGEKFYSGSIDTYEGNSGVAADEDIPF